MTDLDRLKRFVKKILPDSAEDWGDIDGFDLERVCLECGLLERVERTEFCGEECACAGYYGSDEFPIQCNQWTELGKACRDTETCDD